MSLLCCALTISNYSHGIIYPHKAKEFQIFLFSIIELASESIIF